MRLKKCLAILFIVWSGYIYGQQKQIACFNGTVVSAHPLASKIGLEVLEKGGTAFDAAIAVEFALSVCYPVAGNIGGGGFIVYYKADGTMGSLDYREKAPGRAAADMYLDAYGNVIKDLSVSGRLAVGVPGTVAGMVEVHKKLGTLDWKDLLQPAIDMARNGLELTYLEAERLNLYRGSFMSYNRFVPSYVKNGSWYSGEKIYHHDLANTLERIKNEGNAGFYEGETARLIVEEMQSGGGWITEEDLKNYQAIWRQPVIGSYRGYRVLTMPPPSAGGINLIQMLKMVEPFPLAQYGYQNPQSIQIMVEAMRRAYADRATHIGDADFYDVPMQQLLDTNYIHQRMADFDMAKAGSSQVTKSGQFEKKTSEETTHYSIVDKFGNAVAATTTLNGYYGSKVVVKGGGFFLNNEMDDFSVKPGSPNQYGLVGSQANAIAPNKRMVSSMTPTILLKDGKVFLVVGTPGGSTISNSVFQVIVDVVDFGLSLKDAVDAPRFHHQWLPDLIYYEEGALSYEIIQTLQSKGYKTQKRDNFGRVEAIRVLDGIKEGAADRRGDDDCEGY